MEESKSNDDTNTSTTTTNTISFDSKCQHLDEILNNGFNRLITYAKKKKYLKEPYGRKPNPTPLLTEEQFLLQGLSSSLS